jgi:hypothetical protein
LKWEVIGQHPFKAYDSIGGKQLIRKGGRESLIIAVEAI